MRRAQMWRSTETKSQLCDVEFGTIVPVKPGMLEIGY